MPASPIVPIVVTFLHDLFTAVWIGGMIVLAAVVMPATRKTLGPVPQVQALMLAIQKRLSPLIYGSIVGLWATGLLLARRTSTGLFSFGTPYAVVLSIKHIAVFLMVAIALLRSLSAGGEGKFAAQNSQKVLLLANLVLGVVVLLLSAAASVLAASLPG